ncbi:hypothetical protein RIF29_15159 [Crotalaria pallida]|uniref:Uncharacterized protein n=1 Tax=Crotalaria pallida TaxID=3830 RepID=A0AAN9ICD0_CROPI
MVQQTSVQTEREIESNTASKINQSALGKVKQIDSSGGNVILNSSSSDPSVEELELGESQERQWTPCYVCVHEEAKEFTRAFEESEFLKIQ